jgi:simple sugar transport system substrate-binding protein
MSAFAPKAHLASAIVDWSAYYIKTMEEAMNGTWKGNQVTRWGVKEGQNDLIKIADVVPAETKAKVEEIKAGMKAGTFEVFTGPITDNTGKVVLEKGKAADDAWKGDVKFYVKGVEGKVPADSK